jgi:hypothetical protein
MVGTSGEEHGGCGLGTCGSEGQAGWTGWATLTVDLHMEGHTGAARCIAGCAAVVPAVICAQGLQLEEPALLRELGVGIGLQSPTMGKDTSAPAPGKEDQGTIGAAQWPLPLRPPEEMGSSRGSECLSPELLLKDLQSLSSQEQTGPT